MDAKEFLNNVQILNFWLKLYNKTGKLVVHTLYFSFLVHHTILHIYKTPAD